MRPFWLLLALLAPVWSQSPQPAFYPPGLRAVLNQVQAQAGPRRWAACACTWAQYDQLSSGKPARQAQQLALYFGAGGNYHAAEVQGQLLRARRLTPLETDVRLVAQDLQKLMGELNVLAP
ncbi:hypothetical protein [uncultured Hymenobacter sp.]|uniref:hypothetical protein n=1 Tax=uncultured Hymenobacter sp. TaxID=170016 RepID=UPI0035CB7AE6